LFSTVVSPRGLTDTLNSYEWQQLVSSGLECFDYKDYDDINIRLAPLYSAPKRNPDDDDKSSVVSCVLPAPQSPSLWPTQHTEPPCRTLSDVIDDMVQDMSPTSQTEGADEVVVGPTMPAPEGEVLDTNNDSGDQAPVVIVAEPRPPPAPNPAPNL
jgi:hypothetical protein